MGGPWEDYAPQAAAPAAPAVSGPWSDYQQAAQPAAGNPPDEALYRDTLARIRAAAADTKRPQLPQAGSPPIDNSEEGMQRRAREFVANQRAREDEEKNRPTRETYKNQIRRAQGEGVREAFTPSTYADNVPMPSFAGMVRNKALDPFGVQDELVGGGLYAGSVIGDLAHLRQPDLDKANQEYTRAVERIRAENEIVRERLGWGGNLAAEVAGGFGTTMNGAKAASTALPPLWQRIRESAKAGAAFGAAAGAGHAEGDLSERATGAAWGAGTGAVAGPALSEVVIPGAVGAYQLAKTAPSAVSNAVRTVIPGFRANIDERLLTALKRQNMTPADLQAQMAADDAARTFRAGSGEARIDVPLVLADSGPAMRDLAYAAKAQPGQARTEAEALLEGRQRGLEGQSSQYGRMAEAVRRSLRVTRDKAVRTEDRVTAKRGTAADAAYDAFRNFKGTIPVDDILQAHAADMADRLTTGSKLFGDIEGAYAPFADEVHGIGAVQGPSLTEQARFKLSQTALDNRIAKAAEAGDADGAKALQDLKQGQAQEFAAKTKDVNLTAPSYDLTPAKFDAAKQQLDDMIGTAVRAGDNYKTSLLTDLKNRLVQRADEVTTVQGPNGPVSLYAAARESYASPTQVLNALEGGRGFLKGAPERTAQEYGAMSTPEKRAYRVGAADTTIRQFGSKRSGVNIPEQLDTPNIQGSLKAVAGPAGLDKLNAYSGLETRMFQTRKRVMGGSPTNENQLGTQDFTLATRLGRQLKEGQVFGAVGDLIASTFQHVYRFREMDARLLARDLFSTDRSHQQAVVQRLAQAYGKRAARFAVSEATRLAQRHLASAATAPIVNNLLGLLPSSQTQAQNNALLGRR